MAAERYWTSTAGGMTQAGPTNLGNAVAQAVHLREHGYAAFVRDANHNQVELTVSKTGVFDLVSFGVRPEWADAALRFITSMNREVAHS